jgi:TonB-linked SusC/RagA family outer membrane protein
MTRSIVRRATLLRTGLLLAVLCVLWALPAAAQTGQISGRVVDAVSGQPLEGAQVTVVGTAVRARTRRDGLYNLTSVPIGSQQVRASVVGYSMQTATLVVQTGITSTVDFSLAQAVISLDAMVVTGTAGEISRREVGNSISQISSQEFENLPITDLGQILQGRTPGITVMEASGQAGTGQRIRLRGINSFSMGNNPVVIVDGVVMKGTAHPDDDETGNQGVNPLHDINPEDIDRIEVIKGAAASTLYGTGASAGVIQIFTKRGSVGEPRWSVAIDQGFNTLGHIGPDASTNPTGLGMNKCGYTGNGIAGDQFETGDFMWPADTLGCPASGSWLRRGHTHRYNVSVRGGREDINYFISGRWGSEDGIIDPQNATDWSIRGNFGFALGPALTLQFNNTYARRDILFIPDGDNAEGMALNVFRGVNGYTINNDDSQVLDLSLKQATNHFMTGFTLNWTPFYGMSQRLNVGLDYSQSDWQEERPWGFYYRVLGNKQNRHNLSRLLTLDYAMTWTTSVGSSVSSSFSAGAQMYQDFRYSLIGWGEDFAGPGDKVVDNGAITTANENRITYTSGGFFFQEQLGFRDRLFIMGGVRFDGFSTFGEDYGMAAYPKASVAYNISEESFWPEFWDGMKLRAAYGQSGRAPGVFDAVKTWESTSGDEAQPAVTPSTLGAPDLGPERSRELEFGFEASLFNGRLGVDFTKFHQVTKDALIDVPALPSEGFYGTQLENVGEIENNGLEIQVSMNVLRSPAFGWNLGFRYSGNKNQVNDLGGLEDIYLTWRQNIRPCYMTLEDGTKILSSEAIRQLAWKYGITASPGDLQYLNKVECPVPGWWHQVITDSSAALPAGNLPAFEERYLGPTMPRHTLGFNTTFQIGRWLTIDAVGESQLGHWLSSGTAYQNARRDVWPGSFTRNGVEMNCRDLLVAWTAVYDEARASGLSTSASRSAAHATQTPLELAQCNRYFTTYGMWIQPADFFKLRSLSFTFRLPERLIPGTRSALLQIQARNLFTITGYTGIDPEASEAGSSEQLWRQEYYNLPPYRSFTASLRLEF